VQVIFPGTESWLLSCSDAEGYNRGAPTAFVMYGGVPFNLSDYWANTVGGPLQFRRTTFQYMYAAGLKFLVGRGYHVPQHLRVHTTTTAFRSMLAQAIAGGWARYTGNDDSHWSASWGRGC